MPPRTRTAPSPVAASGAPPPAGKPAPPRRVRPVPAVSRSIAILRLLGRAPEPLGVKAIAQQLELVPSTCLHILRVLVDEELLRVDPATKRYSLGVGMLPLARSVLEKLSFPNAVQPMLDEVARMWDITAIGVEVSGLDHMTVLALSKSKSPFRLQVDVGSRFPALVSATGRLAAAYSQLPWRDIEKRFRDVRWGKAPDLPAWRKELESVRQKGYAIDRGNYIPGVTIVGAPVLDLRGQLTHTLVGAGVAHQLGASRSLAVAKQLKVCAEKLTQMLAQA